MSRMEDEARQSEVERELQGLLELRGGPQAEADFRFLRQCLRVARAMSKEAFGTQHNANTALQLLDLMTRVQSAKPSPSKDEALERGEASFEAD